jgi:hypothetical protein
MNKEPIGHKITTSVSKRSIRNGAWVIEPANDRYYVDGLFFDDLGKAETYAQTIKEKYERQERDREQRVKKIQQILAPWKSETF